MDYQRTSGLIDGSIQVSGVPTEQLLLSNPPGFFVASNKEKINLPKGTPVAVDPSGTGFVRAKAASGLAAYGILVEDAAVGFTATVMSSGVLVMGDWTVLAGTIFLGAKADYYLGANGLYTSNIPSTPGQISQFIGRAISPVALQIEIERPTVVPAFPTIDDDTDLEERVETLERQMAMLVCFLLEQGFCLPEELVEEINNCNSYGCQN